MRTTVRLDDDLMRETRRLAAEQGRTVTSLIEDALREVVARRSEPPAMPVSLHTVGGGGLREGIDLDDSAALLAHMEQEG